MRNLERQLMGVAGFKIVSSVNCQSSKHGNLAPLCSFLLAEESDKSPDIRRPVLKPGYRHLILPHQSNDMILPRRGTPILRDTPHGLSHAIAYCYTCVGSHTHLVCHFGFGVSLCYDNAIHEAGCRHRLRLCSFSHLLQYGVETFPSLIFDPDHNPQLFPGYPSSLKCNGTEMATSTPYAVKRLHFRGSLH